MDKPARKTKIATMSTPIVKTAFSPNKSTSFPEINPEAKRVIANIEIIKPIAVLLTPNVRAKIGIAGKTIPKPTATKKDAATSAMTSRGRSLKGVCINQMPHQQPLHAQPHTPH